MSIIFALIGIVLGGFMLQAAAQCVRPDFLRGGGEYFDEKW